MANIHEWIHFPRRLSQKASNRALRAELNGIQDCFHAFISSIFWLMASVEGNWTRSLKTLASQQA